MGSMIQAKCECGFDSGTIVAGGGFMNFRSMGMEPALCQHCKRLVMRDYKTKSSRCPECHKKVTFYNDPKLQIQRLEGQVLQSRIVQTKANRVIERDEKLGGHPLRGTPSRETASHRNKRVSLLSYS